jgi:hypothetical protein
MDYFEQLENDVLQLDYLEEILQENKHALEVFTEEYNNGSDYDELFVVINEYMEETIAKYESVETNAYNLIIQAIHTQFYADIDKMTAIIYNIDASIVRRDVRILLCQILAILFIVGIALYIEI